MADIVVDGRNKVRRVAAEDADLVDFPVLGMYPRSSRRILPSGVRSTTPTLISSSAPRGPAASPLYQFDELLEADVPPFERKIDGCPESSLNLRSRTQPVMTRAARLIRSRAPRSSWAGSRFTRNTSLRERPVRMDTRDLDCFRPGISNFSVARFNVDALRDIGEGLVGNAVPQEEHHQGAKQLRDGGGNGFCDVLVHIWDHSPKYNPLSRIIFFSGIDGEMHGTLYVKQNSAIIIIHCYYQYVTEVGIETPASIHREVLTDLLTTPGSGECESDCITWRRRCKISLMLTRTFFRGVLLG